MVLTGISCRFPGVKRRVQETYPNALVHCDQGPERVVALGAAKQAFEIGRDAELLDQLRIVNGLSPKERV